MTKIATEKKNSYSWILLLIAVFSIFFILTALTPYIADDFNYAFSWSYDSRVDNIVLLIGSMAGHRLYTHGRVFAQGCATLFMMWPKWSFSVANGIMAAAFFSSLHHFFTRKGIENSSASALGVVVICWICMPVFGQVFLWLDGACNYFWGAALAWILLEVEYSNRDNNLVLMVLLLLLAFIVGAWSEHISFAAIIIQILFIIRVKIKEKRIPISMFLILLFSCFGYLFLMLAPSMLPTILKSRAKTAAGGHLHQLTALLLEYWWIIPVAVVVALLAFVWLKTKPDRKSRYVVIVFGAFSICTVLDLYYLISTVLNKGFYGVISSTPIGFMTLMCCFFLCLGKAIQQCVQKDIILEAIFFAVGGLSALALFALAMYIPARGFCAPVVFIGIATVMLWSSLKQKKKRVAIVAFALVFAVYFTAGATDIYRVSVSAKERIVAINEALSKDRVLITSPYPVKTKYSAQYGLLDLAMDQSWPNDVIMRYYGLDEIIVISQTGDLS